MLIAIDHSRFFFVFVFLLFFFFCIPDVMNISASYYTQSFVHSFVNVESNTAKIAHNTQIYTMEKFHLTFDILVFSPLDCAHVYWALLYVSFNLGKQTLQVTKKLRH